MRWKSSSILTYSDDVAEVALQLVPVVTVIDTDDLVVDLE